MIAILDDSDVDIENIAVLEHAIAGNTVADHLIDRGTDGLGKTMVVERRRDGALFFRVLGADIVELVGADPGLDVRGYHFQYTGGQLAGGTHFLNFVCCLDDYTHGGFLLITCVLAKANPTCL